MNTLPRSGKVDWIGLRPERRAPMNIVAEVSANPTLGLQGDRYSGRSGSRQVTLIQAEHLQVIAAFVGLDSLPPELLRRNLAISGINLLALKGKRFRAGEVQLEFTGLCQPCRRMEELLGDGGYNAMRGHGGITARVLTAGRLAIGDTLSAAKTDA